MTNHTYSNRSSASSRLLICIDRAEMRELGGRIYHRFSDQPMQFVSVLQLLTKMEALFDSADFPQVTHEYRSFHGKREACTKERRVTLEIQDSVPHEQGEKGTFIVHVQFRQNASWQGSIRWVEQKKEQRFRSTLEMIKLIDEALDGGDKPEITWINAEEESAE